MMMSQPKPARAWACFAESGNCIIWSTDESVVRSIADAHDRPVTPLYDLGACPVAIMDTRCALGLCAPTVADFHSLYALQGHRVALVDLGPDMGADKNNAPVKPQAADDLRVNQRKPA